MADDLAKTAGAGTTFTVGEKTYSVKPPTVSDMAAFQKYIKTERITTFIDAVKDMEVIERMAIIKEIIATPITQEDINAEANTLSGQRFIMYRCIRHNEGITMDNMDEIVTAANMMEVDTLIGSLGGAVENPPEVTQGPETATEAEA